MVRCMFEPIVEPYLKVMTIVWARGSRRSLSRGLAIPESSNPDEIAERYGELSLAVVAIDHALRLVAAHVRRTGHAHPLASGAASLARRVSRLRNLIEHEDEEIASGFLVRVQGDALVGRQGGAAFTLTFPEWRAALDQIETWAIR